jgi:hypothetical protein
MHGFYLFTDESLDLEKFKDAIENREEADWDTLYKNYNAAVDVPTWFWYKDLVKKYPDAKVILTIRDPESWYISMKNMYAILKDPKYVTDSGRPRQVTELGRNFFHHPSSPTYGNLEDKESTIAAYIKHNQDVIDFVPKENLLIMELGEGWERLCEFLGKPIPNVPYPNLHKPKEFEETINEIVEAHNNSLKILTSGETE